MNQLDFSVITMGMKGLPFFNDDVYLGMQGMNVGIVDAIITEQEYLLLREWIETERTPGEIAMAVSALSQMWVYGLYEALRLWRDRRYQFDKLLKSGGIEAQLKRRPTDDEMNPTVDTRMMQLERYEREQAYRDEVEAAWSALEPVYRLTELFRMNLAKHCAPGRDRVVPRAPGYGRINRWCGAMDYELVDRDGDYAFLNRRDIADALRKVLRERNSSVRSRLG